MPCATRVIAGSDFILTPEPVGLEACWVVADAKLNRDALRLRSRRNDSVTNITSIHAYEPENTLSRRLTLEKNSYSKQNKACGTDGMGNHHQVRGNTMSTEDHEWKLNHEGDSAGSASVNAKLVYLKGGLIP